MKVVWNKVVKNPEILHDMLTLASLYVLTYDGSVIYVLNHTKKNNNN